MTAPTTHTNPHADRTKWTETLHVTYSAERLKGAAGYVIALRHMLLSHPSLIANAHVVVTSDPMTEAEERASMTDETPYLAKLEWDGELTGTFDMSCAGVPKDTHTFSRGRTVKAATGDMGYHLLFQARWRAIAQLNRDVEASMHLLLHSLITGLHNRPADALKVVRQYLDVSAALHTSLPN